MIFSYTLLYGGLVKILRCFFQGVAGSKSLVVVPLEQIRALLGAVDGHGTMLAYSRTPVIVKQMDVMDLRQSRSTLPWLPYWEY